VSAWLAIPLYQVPPTIGLLDTLPGLILVYKVYCLAFAIWMLLGFVRDVPMAYEGEAMIKGAGLGRRLLTIALPLDARSGGHARVPHDPVPERDRLPPPPPRRDRHQTFTLLPLM